MPVDIHLLGVLPESQDARQDKILFAKETVSTSAGSAAGANVVVQVQFRSLPASGYHVFTQANQACDVMITGKTPTGFTMTLVPPSSSVTLAAGTVDVLVMG